MEKGVPNPPSRKRFGPHADAVWQIVGLYPNALSFTITSGLVGAIRDGSGRNPPAITSARKKDQKTKFDPIQVLAFRPPDSG
jgi:hypothetical protein